MFGELPNLFGRNFVIGYFLPVAVFAVVSFGLITEFNQLLPEQSDLSPKLLFLTQDNAVLNATIAVLVLWLIAVVLLAANQSIYMLMEGYGGKLNPAYYLARGKYNPARLLAWDKLAWKEKERYDRLTEKISKKDRKYRNLEKANKTIPRSLEDDRGELMQMKARRFPHERSLVLPTAFGNTIRAWEVYPYQLYGLDAAQGWPRLQAVITNEYRELVDDAKAQTDFWLNLWFLSLLIIFEYVGVAIYVAVAVNDSDADQVTMLWLPVIALLFAFFASSRARNSAVLWGIWVKSAFDAFLPDFGAKLGISSATIPEQKKNAWELFSKAIIYRSPETMAALSRSLQTENGSEPNGSNADLKRSSTLHQNVVPENSVDWSEQSHSAKFAHRRKQLGSTAGGEKLGCSLYEVAPGRRAWPYRYHLANEKAIYVLEGSGTLRIGDKEVEISRGDYVALLTGEAGAHQVINSSDTLLRYLYFSTMVEPDILVHPDSDKVGLFAGSAPDGPNEKRTLQKYLRANAEVSYYEGEE